MREEALMGNRPRGPLFILAVVIAVVGLLALPAAADPPNVETFTETFVAPNPCLGNVEQHTITITTADHFHGDTEVLRDVDRHGFTESGFLLEGGRFHLVEMEAGIVIKLKDVWRHPDTLEAFQAVLEVRVVGNAPVIDEFTLECLTGPTILP
ncbi:MAG: hypothetical protein ACRDVL_12440 [Acidimicrobiia bacterium]